MQKGDIQKLISDGPSKSNGYLISKAWVSALNEKPESDQLLQLPPINNLPLLYIYIYIYWKLTSVGSLRANTGE